MRITKKREHDLRMAIMVDELLYEKFRRLNEDLQRRERKFSARRQVSSVLMRQKKFYRQLQILSAHETPSGLEIIVAGISGGGERDERL